MPGKARASPLVSETSLALTGCYIKNTLDSPIDPVTGSPVDPLELPQYLQKNEWTRPACLCSIRGIDRKTVLTPVGSGSPLQWEMYLVCPEGECPYLGTLPFVLCQLLHCIDPTTVNLTLLVKNHKEDTLANHHWDSAADGRDEGMPWCDRGINLDRSLPDHTETPTASARKRRLIFNARRFPSWRIIAAGVSPPKKPSSSSKMRSEASSTEVVSIVSELFGPDGILRAKFELLFLLCEVCDRVMLKVGQATHKCLMDTPSSDSELEEDIASILRK